MKRNTEHQDFKNLAFHPYNIILILAIAGISALFIGLTIAYVYTKFQNGLEKVDPPLLFLINTLILLTSSYTIHQAIKHYKADDTRLYTRSLWFTLILSLVFLISQFFAWESLIRQNILVNSGNGASYLYMLSGVHFLHVIVGIPFLGQFIHSSIKKMKEPVSVLVYFSDPVKRLRLRLLNIYWHFLDILWILLVLTIFIVNI